MTILDISLCLPELDIVALRQKRSIVAVTQRFIVPDRSFALLPCRISSETASSSYHAHVLADLESDVRSPSKPISATHWAQCVFCQPVDERAIATLANLTIWTADALSQRLQNGSLFLSFLRTYALLEPFVVEFEPACEQIYKFMPLPHYLEASTEFPVYNNEDFTTAKQNLLKPKNDETERTNNTELEEETIETESIPNSLDWIEMISEVGNSSNGHDFEKLVRKGLISLGFSNSLNQSTASLDPEATGGAGGIDFYADQPYPIAGECKASAIDQVGRPARQLHNLGIQWLGLEGYSRAVKLVIAGGDTTKYDEQFANSSETNVIRPETFQALLVLKTKYEQSFTLSSLKTTLSNPPFGKAANEKLSALIQKWQDRFEENAAAALEHSQYRQQANQIVQTVKELSQQSIHQDREGFSLTEVRSHYNAKYQLCLTDKDIKNALDGLTSPFAAGCLERRSSSDNQAAYAFIKDMTFPNL